MRLRESEIEEIICLYQSGEKPKVIGEKFGIYNNSVTRILRKRGIDRNQVKKISQEQKDYICSEYKNGKNSEVLAKELELAGVTICRVLKTNNILIRPAIENKRKLKLNLNWLDVIDVEEKAYFLGLFWADGNISKYGNGISLRLHIKDCKILTKLSHYFYNTDHVHYLIDGTGETTSMSRLCVYSQHIKNRLLEIGLFPNKCKTVKFPSKEIINDNLLPHFLRGLLDGDGCICVRKSGRVTVDYTGNTFVIHSIQDILNVKNIKSKIFYSQRKDSWSIQINNRKEAAKFLDWIYLDSTIYLERKYNKYLELKKLENDIL
ncbi:MAG: LAGLIDADG family homing endonuclease [Candidatus Woesearchaeota archaeon]|jgi:intein-encoded DNA endonuclease-like protein